MASLTKIIVTPAGAQEIPLTDDEIAQVNADAAAFAAQQTAQAWIAYQAKAQAALDVSDAVAIRCLKAAVPFPADWQAYVATMRGIMAATSGDPTQPLPIQPAYPIGT